MPFISFFLRYYPDYISNAVLNRSGESRYPCPVHDHRREEFRLNIKYGIRCRFFEDGLFQVEDHFSFLFIFFENSESLGFFQTLFCIQLDDHVGFVLYFLDIVYYQYINWYLSIKPSFHSWNKSQLVVMFHCFLCCWILFGSILLRIFTSTFIQYNSIVLRALLTSIAVCDFLKHLCSFRQHILNNSQMLKFVKRILRWFHWNIF